MTIKKEVFEALEKLENGEALVANVKDHVGRFNDADAFKRKIGDHGYDKAEDVLAVIEKSKQLEIDIQNLEKLKEKIDTGDADNDKLRGEISSITEKFDTYVKQVGIDKQKDIDEKLATKEKQDKKDALDALLAPRLNTPSLFAGDISKQLSFVNGRLEYTVGDRLHYDAEAVDEILKSNADYDKYLKTNANNSTTSRTRGSDIANNGYQRDNVKFFDS